MTHETLRTSAYLEDLRWRVVWQSEALRYSVSQIAGNLKISKSTVERIINTFSASGTICKQPYPAENVFRVITELVKLFIFHLVLKKPGILLCEIV